MSKTLVIILAETRGHDLTWENNVQNFIGPLNADLSLCVGYREGYDRLKDPFYKNAKYTIEYNEPKDYSEAYNIAAKFYGKEKDSWRKILQVKDQLFGGIKDLHNEHRGAGGLLIFYRWLFIHTFPQSKLDDYDRFIITRSDFFYKFTHIPLGCLDPHYIWIPEGENYGGITDRHMIVNRADLHSCLNFLEKIITDTDNLLIEMTSMDTNWNIEKFLMFQMKKNNLYSKIRIFPRSMFTVRGAHHTSRWDNDPKLFLKEHNFYVKYIAEYYNTMLNYDRYTGCREDWNDMIRYLHFVAMSFVDLKASR